MDTASLLGLEREAAAREFSQYLRPHGVHLRVAAGATHLVQPVLWHVGAVPPPPGARPWPRHLRCMAVIEMDDGTTVLSLLDVTPRSLRRGGTRIVDAQARLDALGATTPFVDWLDGIRRVDVDGPFGRLAAWCDGPADGPTVIGLHGLTGDHRQLEPLGETVTEAGSRFVGLDLRGRGESERTGSGSYGWERHALDVLAVADALGAERFSVVGVSMGASVAMELAALAPERLDAVVLVDVAGRVDPGVGPVIAERLAAADPASADPAAVAEDRAYGLTQDPHDRWRHLTMPTLLVRATREMRPGSGLVVPAAVRDAFVDAVPRLAVVEVDASHLTVAHDVATADAVVEFLGACV